MAVETAKFLLMYFVIILGFSCGVKILYDNVDVMHHGNDKYVIETLQIWFIVVANDGDTDQDYQPDDEWKSFVSVIHFLFCDEYIILFLDLCWFLCHTALFILCRYPDFQLYFHFG